MKHLFFDYKILFFFVLISTSSQMGAHSKKSLKGENIHVVKPLENGCPSKNSMAKKAVKELDETIKPKRINFFKCYVDSGEDPNIVGKKGRTLLSVFVANNDIDYVSKIFKSNCNINTNQISKNGWTALQIAANRGNIEMAKILVSHGSSIAVRGNQFRNPVEEAIRNANYDVINYLLTAEEIPIAERQPIRDWLIKNELSKDYESINFDLLGPATSKGIKELAKIAKYLPSISELVFTQNKNDCANLETIEQDYKKKLRQKIEYILSEEIYPLDRVHVEDWLQRNYHITVAKSKPPTKQCKIELDLYHSMIKNKNLSLLELATLARMTVFHNTAIPISSLLASTGLPGLASGTTAASSSTSAGLPSLASEIPTFSLSTAGGTPSLTASTSAFSWSTSGLSPASSIFTLQPSLLAWTGLPSLGMLPTLIPYLALLGGSSASAASIALAAGTGFGVILPLTAGISYVAYKKHYERKFRETKNLIQGAYIYLGIIDVPSGKEDKKDLLKSFKKEFKKYKKYAMKKNNAQQIPLKTSWFAATIRYMIKTQKIASLKLFFSNPSGTNPQIISEIITALQTEKIQMKQLIKKNRFKGATNLKTKRTIFRSLSDNFLQMKSNTPEARAAVLETEKKFDKLLRDYVTKEDIYPSQKNQW